MESPRVSWQYLFNSFHRFTQYLCVLYTAVLLGTPFALALHISSSVFGAAGIPEQRTCKMVLRGLGSFDGQSDFS